MPTVIKDVVVEWVTSHCGFYGNESADNLAKKWANVLLINDTPIPFHTVKRLMKIIYPEDFRKNVIERKKQKMWFNRVLAIRFGLEKA